MALKDWKKTYMNGNQYTRKISKDVIMISHRISQGDWVISVFDPAFDMTEFKYFPSRPLALKFMKSYMRTH